MVMVLRLDGAESMVGRVDCGCGDGEKDPQVVNRWCSAEMGGRRAGEGSIQIPDSRSKGEGLRVEGEGWRWTEGLHVDSTDGRRRMEMEMEMGWTRENDPVCVLRMEDRDGHGEGWRRMEMDMGNDGENEDGRRERGERKERSRFQSIPERVSACVWWSACVCVVRVRVYVCVTVFYFYRPCVCVCVCFFLR